MPSGIHGPLDPKEDNTHYALLLFSGDPGEEHPDDELRGLCPSTTLLAAGPEPYCWEAVLRWTEANPLRLWEHAEVVARDPNLVRRSTTEHSPYI
jgi:hypothetical protein